MNSNLRFACVLGGLSAFAISVSGVFAGSNYPSRRVNSGPDYSRPLTAPRKYKAYFLPPLDVEGGKHLAAARGAIQRAIIKTKSEIEEQERLASTYKKRVNEMGRKITSIEKDKSELQTVIDQIAEERHTLRALPEPTQAILDCLAELEQDLTQARVQMKNIDDALELLYERNAYLEKVGLAAQVNVRKLKASLNDLNNSKKKIDLVRIPALSAEVARKHVFVPHRKFMGKSGTREK